MHRAHFMCDAFCPSGTLIMGIPIYPSPEINNNASAMCVCVSARVIGVDGVMQLRHQLVCPIPFRFDIFRLLGFDGDTTVSTGTQSAATCRTENRIAFRPAKSIKQSLDRPGNMHSIWATIRPTVSQCMRPKNDGLFLLAQRGYPRILYNLIYLYIWFVLF